MSDARFDDRPCPECGHHPTRWRDCTAPMCENGQVDRSRTDPILYPTVGPHYEPCGRCGGAGRHHWCPECGTDLTHRDDLQEPIRHQL